MSDYRHHAERFDVPGGWIYFGGPLPSPVYVADPSAWAKQPNDPRLDQIVAGIASIQQEITRMSETQDTIANEVVTLKSNMVGLHAGITGIQGRLDAALAAAAATTDPAVLTDLQAVNTDLKAVVDGLAPAAAAAA